ncbi:MAG: ketoacyl-ACP synthase III [Oligoflexia bacterium]|nr:ketoacyl-ACP synthase III [Oligoflexia bacterium]
MRSAIIAGIGMHHPSRLIENSFFNEKYQIDIDSFLREKRNIHQRYHMEADEATSDLIVPAIEKALQSAKITKDEVDLLIVATDTPDYLSPSTASVVQHKMGLKNAGTFDLNSACAGFVTALDVAKKYISSDEQYRNIVVVGAYGMSKYLNWDDYKIASLFADGAGAVVVQASAEEGKGILSSKLFTLGEYYDYMGVYGGGTAMPTSHEAIEKKENLLNFAKKIPLETNPTHWPRLARLVLDKSNRKLQDVKKFFLTQINIGSIDETMKNLELPASMSHNIMDKYGYTGSACIPMAMADAVEKKILNKGDLIVLVGSGGGVSMASLVIEWTMD